MTNNVLRQMLRIARTALLAMSDSADTANRGDLPAFASYYEDRVDQPLGRLVDLSQLYRRAMGNRLNPRLTVDSAADFSRSRYAQADAAG